MRTNREERKREEEKKPKLADGTGHLCLCVAEVMQVPLSKK